VPGGWTRSGADQSDRDDGHAGPQRDPGDAGAEPVQPPVRGPGALRVDPERLALVEQIDADIHRGGRRAHVATLHRYLPDAAEERRHGLAAQARRGEVLRLGQVEDLTTCPPWGVKISSANEM
jgi:hypothetical protein